MAKATLAHLKHRPSFTPGAALYYVYHRPWGWAKRVSTAGALNFWRGAVARRNLRLRVLHGELAPMPASKSDPGLTVDLLTGQQFCAESVVVAHSFACASGSQCDFHFYDDGTLGKQEIAALRRWFPDAAIHHRTEIESRLAGCLPLARYPVLHALRGALVLMKKLTDLAAGTGGWRLYLDSDMLFFQKPSTLLRYVAEQRPFHLVDAMPSYGAPLEFLNSLAGHPVHPKVNSGLYFRNVDTIDWDFIEDSSRVLLARFGYSYFIEQTLAALLFARESASALDDAYLVLPSPEECKHPTRTLHHYVNQSRWAFYVNGWRGLQRDFHS